MPHFKKIVLASALNLALFALASNAALVMNINGLDIDGTFYDVTFHSDKSFNDLWDSDGDKVFGNDGSMFNAMPTFWGGSLLGAQEAANAIAAVLSTDDTTTAGGADGFVVPYLYRASAQNLVNTFLENDTTPAGDDVVIGSFELTQNLGGSTYVYASFTPTVIPVPAAVWLFGSGLIGLIGLARRKVRV